MHKIKKKNIKKIIMNNQIVDIELLISTNKEKKETRKTHDPTGDGGG